MSRFISKGPLFILIAAFLWGIDGILRRSLYTLPPIIIVFYEHLIAAVIIAPFLLKSIKKETISKKVWGSLIWVSFLSGTLGTLWFTTALMRTNFISFSVVFLLQKLQPIFAITLGALVLKEKVTKAYIKWAALAFVAAYFVTFKDGIVNLGTGTGTVVAALYAVGAAFTWGSSTAFSRYGLLKLSHTTMTGLRFWLTVPIALLFVFITGNHSSFSAPDMSQYIRLIVIAFSTGMIATWIYYKGLKITQVKISTIVELFLPVTAIGIDLIVYKNTLSISQYLAVAVLLFAIHKVSLLNKETKI